MRRSHLTDEFNFHSAGSELRLVESFDADGDVLIESKARTQAESSEDEGIDPTLLIGDFVDDPGSEEDQDQEEAAPSQSLVVVDEENLPECCRAGHCCNPKCTLSHVGSAGYSIENSTLYSDTAYSFALTVGMLSNTPLWSLTMIILVFMTISLTLGNYRSYLSIMDRFLSRFSVFGESEQDFSADFETSRFESFWNAIAISNAIIKVAVPCYSVFRFSSFIFNGIFSIESIAPSVATTVVLGASAIPASVAFFYEGNNRKTLQDPDATFSEPRVLVLPLPVSIEEDRKSNFVRVVKNPVVPRFLNHESDNELQLTPQNGDLIPYAEKREDDLVEINPLKKSSRCNCCSKKRCCNAHAFYQHSGTSGFSLLNAVAYSNSALSFLDNLGLVKSHPILSTFGLFLVTGSVTIANYSAYLVIMGNFLLRCVPAPAESSNAGSCCSRFWQGVVKVNIVPATLCKVGISSLSFFRVSNRVVQGNLPTSITATTLVSAANILATTALFSLQNKPSSKSLENRVEELSDEDAERLQESEIEESGAGPEPPK